MSLISEEKSLTILFSPLNWGLGHASRGIYLIQILRDMGHEVIMAADGEAYFLLRDTFPALELYRLPFYQVKYSRIFPLWLKMLFSLPAFFASVRKEHRLLKKWLSGRHIDLILSDNRYGLYHKDIVSVMITHQLFVTVPGPLRFFEPVVEILNRRRLNKFSEIWVPDFSDVQKSLAGKLSHTQKPLNSPVRYLGPLSRFMHPAMAGNKPIKVIYDVLVVLSGPEPQRTMLEQILIRKLRNTSYKVLIIRGMPWGKTARRISNNIRLVTHLEASLLFTYMSEARYIISRAGYSSVMDLFVMKKPALLVPTPGQPEQEYLARHLSPKGLFVFMEQQQIDLQNAFEQLDTLKPDRIGQEVTDTKKSVIQLVQDIYQSRKVAIKNPPRNPI